MESLFPFLCPLQKEVVFIYNYRVGLLCIALWLGIACNRPGLKMTDSKSIRDSISVQASVHLADSVPWPESFELGRLATQKEIAVLDIDIRPDGKGLPAGAGTSVAGKKIYSAKCAACHGKTGVEGPNNQLVGIMQNTKEKTIGNYWPYSTTLFDYIRRAMPFNEPGSLTDEEVYNLTAFLLSSNQIIDSTTVMNAETLPKVSMPAQKHFVIDDRRGGPEVR